MKQKHCVVCQAGIRTERLVMNNGNGKRFTRTHSNDGILFAVDGTYNWFCNDCWKLVSDKSFEKTGENFSEKTVVTENE